MNSTRLEYARKIQGTLIATIVNHPVSAGYMQNRQASPLLSRSRMNVEKTSMRTLFIEFTHPRYNAIGTIPILSPGSIRPNHDCRPSGGMCFKMTKCSHVSKQAWTLCMMPSPPFPKSRHEPSGLCKMTLKKVIDPP